MFWRMLRQSDGAGPTPAERIRGLVTELVELPTLSRRAGEPVRVLIRAIDCLSEYLPIVRGLPTIPEDPEERAARFASLDERSRDEEARQILEADKKLILLAVLQPRVIEQDLGEADTIPLFALVPDRIHLVRRILELSKLLAAPAPRVEAGAPGNGRNSRR